ncbi:hypothetical protein BGW80DRAFT_58265 [Lactifluus volemus]|nr:hypothetical protein BGW80DRAFT_58265 [Lactifluus volemus]
MLAEAAAASTAEDANAKLKAVVSRINELEEELQQGSQLAQEHAARPDLRHSASGQSTAVQKFMTRHMKHALAAQQDTDELIDEEDEIETPRSYYGASVTASYDDISTISPASFTDAEPILDVLSNEDSERATREENDAAGYEDDGDNEDEGNIDGWLDKDAQPENKNKKNSKATRPLNPHWHAEVDNAQSRAPLPPSRPRPRAIYRSTSQDEPSALTPAVTRTPSPPPPTQPREVTRLSTSTKRKSQPQVSR